MAASKQVRSALESMMFVWGEPLAVRTAADVLNVSEAETKEAFEALMEEYDQEQRGIRVRRINKGYQFVTAEENGRLMNKDLVEVKGRSEAIGRPNLYGTTDAFLRYFDLEDIKQLPDIQDIEQVMELPEDYEDSVTMNQISLADMTGEGSEEAAPHAAAEDADAPEGDEL